MTAVGVVCAVLALAILVAMAVAAWHEPPPWDEPLSDAAWQKLNEGPSQSETVPRKST